MLQPTSLLSTAKLQGHGSDRAQGSRESCRREQHSARQLDLQRKTNHKPRHSDTEAALASPGVVVQPQQRPQPAWERLSCVAQGAAAITSAAGAALSRQGCAPGAGAALALAGEAGGGVVWRMRSSRTLFLHYSYALSLEAGPEAPCGTREGWSSVQHTPLLRGTP